MTINSEQIQALKAAAEKATPGEWWSDVIDAEDITPWAVYGPDNRSLLDMLNSTAAEIHEEYDRDYFMQWDDTAKRNADFIAKAHPEFILSLLAERDVDKALIAEYDDALCKLLPSVQYMDPPDGGSVTPLEQVSRMVADYRQQIAELEKYTNNRDEENQGLMLTVGRLRIEREQARKLTVKLPRDITHVTNKYFEDGRDAVIEAIESQLAAAGITLVVEE